MADAGKRWTMKVDQGRSKESVARTVGLLGLHPGRWDRGVLCVLILDHWGCWYYDSRRTVVCAPGNYRGLCVQKRAAPNGS